MKVDQVELNRRQTQLIHTISKYTLLVIIALVPTILLASGTIFLAVSDNNVGWVFIVAGNLNAVDCGSNIVCLTLQFHKFQSYYQRLCGRCDNCCQRIVMHIALTQLKSRKITLDSQAPTPNKPIGDKSLEVPSYNSGSDTENV